MGVVVSVASEGVNCWDHSGSAWGLFCFGSVSQVLIQQVLHLSRGRVVRRLQIEQGVTSSLGTGELIKTCDSGVLASLISGTRWEKKLACPRLLKVWWFGEIVPLDAAEATTAFAACF